ncbi:13151_t:CDS:2, partial [Acaulospora colombiana]
FLVHMKQAAPEAITRFWPQRLVDESTLDTSSRDLQGFYLFGLGSPSSGANAQTADTESAILNCLRSFELKKRELPAHLLPDPFVWSDNGVDSPDADEEEDLQRDLVLPEVADQEEQADPEESWDDFKPVSAAQRKRAAASKSKSTPHIASGKLRTSSDVYNRLMWDTTGPVSKDGYVIGYEDRFLGVKEAPLTAWKREVEDESFVSMNSVDRQTSSLENDQNGDYNAIMKRLEEELDTLLAYKASLEQEIRTILDDYLLNSTILVSRLPIELFTEVLAWVITSEPSSITSLKLVCRAWYRAIIDTPQLCTSIRVIIPGRLDDIAACVAFCKTAVQRSGQLPLDIKVNYSHLPNFETRCEAKFKREWVEPEDKSSSLRWKNHFLRIDGLDHPVPRHLLPLILKPLVTLVGDKGTIMSRWRTFDLIANNFWYVQGWGQGTLSRAIFMIEAMGKPTPLLESLSIQYRGLRGG